MIISIDREKGVLNLNLAKNFDRGELGRQISSGEISLEEVMKDPEAIMSNSLIDDIEKQFNINELCQQEAENFFAFNGSTMSVVCDARTCVSYINMFCSESDENILEHMKNSNLSEIDLQIMTMAYLVDQVRKNIFKDVLKLQDGFMPEFDSLSGIRTGVNAILMLIKSMKYLIEEKEKGDNSVDSETDSEFVHVDPETVTQ